MDYYDEDNTLLTFSPVDRNDTFYFGEKANPQNDLIRKTASQHILPPPATGREDYKKSKEKNTPKKLHYLTQ